MTEANLTDSFTTSLSARNHSFIADEPKDMDGNDLGPTPMEYLEASLASCTTITLKMYLNRKDWDVKSILVNVQINATQNYEYQSIDKNIEIEGILDQKQVDRLLLISKKCPVHKFMEKAITINSSIKLIK